MKASRVIVTAVMALLWLTHPGAVDGAARDPYLGSWKWPNAYVGTYHYHPGMTLLWMKQAATRANATIGHSAYQNPDFHVTSSESTTGYIDQVSNGNSCFGKVGWVGCAYYDSSPTWYVWLASQVCWTDGTNSEPCSGTKFDVETVTLNEMGHVSTLGHHLPETSHDVQGNATYDDAVVQAVPDPWGHPFGSNRALRWADTSALSARYGRDPCTVPPCPTSVDPSEADQ